MSYNKELRTHDHQGRSEPEEVGILTRCVSALLQAAGLFNTPLRGSRHSDLVLQPVTSTTAKWEPIYAGPGSLEPARGKNSSGNGGAPSSPKLSQVSSCLLGNRERQESRSREAAWPWPSNFLIGWLGSGEMPLILAALIHGKGMLLILYLERSTWRPLTDFMSEVTRRSPVMRFSGHFTRDLVGLPCPRLLGSEHHPGYHKIQSQWSFWSVELVSISSLSSKMQSKVENH